MQRSIVALCLISTVCFPLFADLTPEARLDAGIARFRAKDHVWAQGDLEAAVLGLEGLLASGSATAEVYERALIYLALNQSHLGREEASRQTIQRIVSAERVNPVYASLDLGPDFAEFESLVKALAPDSGLKKKEAAPADDLTVPLPTVTPVPVRSVVVPLAPAATAEGLSQFTSLRQAAALVDDGQTVEAMRIWDSLVQKSGTSRDVVIEAAIGLYRIGANRQALPAFERLGVFVRGEEDLRYYYAVVLYETDNVDRARRELACALPFIQRTEDVERFRLKIAQ